MVLQPIIPMSPPDPPATMTPTTPALPPLPPPRCKRRQAPKPPPRIVQPTLSHANGYPSQRDPFYNPDQYKTLRRNLKRVLEGLQQPVPTATISSLPLPLCSISCLTDDSIHSSSTITNLEAPKKKAKTRKLFGSLFKRLTKPFVRKRNPTQDDEIKSSTKSASGLSDKSGIFHPIWLRIKMRSKRKTGAKLPLSSSESISTNGSSQCLYS